MKADEDLDKSEAATPYKLEQARKRGGVARSADAVGALMLITATTWLAWQGLSTLEQLFGLNQAVFQLAGRVGSEQQLWAVSRWGITQAVSILAPLLGALVIAAVLGNLIQTGPALSFDVIQPDLDRLNPVNGLQRIFSMRSVYEALRSCFKLVVLLGIGGLFVLDAARELIGITDASARTQLRTLVDTAASLSVYLCGGLVALAVIDLIYTRREFAKKMRMSRRELRDEHKHREGDPRIRARLRELRRDMMRRSQALRKVKSADVLITNPTHFAVALRYDHDTMEAPEILAKGAGVMALSMRTLARASGIPVVENPALARALYRRGALDQRIPGDMYGQVARIVVWVLALRDAQNRPVAPAV